MRSLDCFHNNKVHLNTDAIITERQASIFSLRSSIGVGKSHFYTETAPMSGVKGGIDVIGSLRNDSVPVTGGIRGDYSFFFRAPISENHGWGVSFFDINLLSSEAFSQSVMKSIRSGILGYTAGRLSQSIGFGDFSSSVIGSLASAYASIDEKADEGVSSLGHISESNNGNELEIEVVGFNPEQFRSEIAQIKQTIFEDAIADGATQEEAEEQAEQETAKIKQDITQEQKKVDETAEKIVKIDEKVKTKAKATNKEKSEALVDGLKALAKKHAELESQQTENIVKQASLQTQLDALNSAKEKYLSELAKIEKEEKVRNSDEAVRSRQVLIWSQLDNHSLVSVSDIKLSNESEIRRAAEEKTAREFKQKRDTVEAEYRARVRYVQNEGFVDIHSGHVFVGVETPVIPLFSERDLNSDNSRLERLRQEELSKVGESTYQRFARFIPVVGSAMDYSYDRISGTEFVGSLGIDVASTLALGGMQKAVVGSKASVQAQFQRNLYAKFNQAPYNPRTSQNLASRLLGADEFTRTTVPGQSMPNVRLAGQCKERIVGTDPFTFEPIIQRIVFDQRGFPIFDPYIKVETRISSPNLNLLSRKKHFQMATQNLYQDILSGKIDRNLFSQSEWLDIEHGRPKIGNYTWHHHQETGRMQLVPTDIHQWIGHIGGFEIWK